MSPKKTPKHPVFHCSMMTSIALSLLNDASRKEVEKRLTWFATTKLPNFKRRVIVTKLARPPRHLVRLTDELYGVVSRNRGRLHVRDVFNQAAAFDCSRRLG